MNLELSKPSEVINDAYLKEKVIRLEVEKFKSEALSLLNKSNDKHSEDTLKDFVSDFLKDTWYKNQKFISINKERKDLSIHVGKNITDDVGVIVEVKKIGSPEMISKAKLNVKAFHELVLYYLREREEIGNLQLKYLVATNVHDWYIFDANEFDKRIYKNKKIKKLFEVVNNDKKDNTYFYAELKKILSDSEETIECAYFNLESFKTIISNNKYEDDVKLLPIIKVLSPQHLLKEPFANDSNSLDKSFYLELLHIIGLEEVPKGTKKLIQRYDSKTRSEASLLENAIIKIQDADCLDDLPNVNRFGKTEEEQVYNIALELCITWVNRILFLKLLEAQLFSYHNDKSKSLFLNRDLIYDFDQLNNLFFKVLAERNSDRRHGLKEKFSHVPYLNSSLFEKTTLEKKTIEISSLDNRESLPLYTKTVLKETNGKRRAGSLYTLDYLFEFLDSYDFTSVGKAEIQEDNKVLINAAVLGLIFEKINGYKDGSFFTPGFITMYMCRETLRRAVVEKFNQVKGWKCQAFKELYNKITDINEANEIVNSIKICDPAVGSGHFLVSALNELIAIKADLRILTDRNGDLLKEYTFHVVNDELIIRDDKREHFQYKPGHNESQRVQEAIFHEKEKLIESCLFGVDINANSVKICRLRLWIELLKHAYYTDKSNFSELETLPNIDINIKRGNSLLSRYGLNDDLKKATQLFEKKILEYKEWVKNYKKELDKTKKKELQRLMAELKNGFKSKITDRNPIKIKYDKKNAKFLNKYVNEKLIDQNLTPAQKKDRQHLEKELASLKASLDAYVQNPILQEAFEWRFEFPEVLDDNGKFLGFDVIIGNPPYGVEFSELEKKIFKKAYPVSCKGKIDSYKLFYELSLRLLRDNSYHSFIAPNTFLYNVQSKSLREELISNTNLIEGVELRKNIFADAPDVVTVITLLQKSKCEDYQTRAKVAYADFKYSNIYNDSWEIDQVIPKSIFQKDKEKKINLRRNFLLDRIINQMNKFPPLSKGFDLKQGTKPYGDKENKEHDLLSKVKLNDDWEAAINGRNIGKHVIRFENDYVKRSDELHSCLPAEIVNSPKIYFQRMRKISLFPRIVASYDDQNIHGLYTCSVIYPKEKTSLDLKYVSALINSFLINVWYKNYDTDIEIKLTSVKNIPIPKISKDLQRPFIELVDKIMKAKKGETSIDVSAAERELDILVYKVYNLEYNDALLIDKTISEDQFDAVKLSLEKRKSRAAL